MNGRKLPRPRAGNNNPVVADSSSDTEDSHSRPLSANTAHRNMCKMLDYVLSYIPSETPLHQGVRLSIPRFLFFLRFSRQTIKGRTDRTHCLVLRDVTVRPFPQMLISFRGHDKRAPPSWRDLLVRSAFGETCLSRPHSDVGFSISPTGLQLLGSVAG